MNNKDGYAFPLPTPFEMAITAEDIAKGERRQCSKCPTAICLGRMLPGWEICADNDGAHLGCPETDAAWFIKFPGYFSNWIIAYDADVDVNPINIQIAQDLIEECTDESRED